MKVQSAVLWLALCSVGCARLLGADDLSFDGPASCSTTVDGECAGGSAGTTPPECANNRDCTPYAWSEPRICRDAACVRLTDDAGCQQVLGGEALLGEEPVFVFGIVGQRARQPRAPSQVYALALQEVSRGGLEVGGRATLPLAVVCDASVTDDAARKSVDHLVNTVGVPAIVASLDGASLEDAFERSREVAGKDVFFLSAFESTERLEELEDDGLLWHMLPSQRDIAPVYLPLIRRAESYLNPPSPEGERRPIRLALIESTGPAFAAVGTYLDEHLTFNGQSAQDNSPEHYLRLSSGAAGRTEAEELERLRAFDADLVVLSGDESLARRAMELPEATRPSGRRGPFYVISPQVTGAPSFWPMMRNVPGLASRVVGISASTAEEAALSDAFLSKLSSFDPSLDGRGAQSFYDAMYFTLYAAAAGGASELTGSSLARGMQRLFEGPRFEVGVSDLATAIGYLRGGTSSIALHGTLGAPTFDRDTGARRGVGSVWCISTASGAPEMQFDALRYDERSGALYGEFPCVEGF